MRAAEWSAAIGRLRRSFPWIDGLAEADGPSGNQAADSTEASSEGAAAGAAGGASPEGSAAGAAGGASSEGSAAGAAGGASSEGAAAGAAGEASSQEEGTEAAAEAADAVDGAGDGRLSAAASAEELAESLLLLKGLPLLTAAALERHYYTDGNPLAEQAGLNVYRTSGTSSGRRKAIYYTPQDEADYLRVKLDVFRELLAGGEWRTAVSDMGTGHAEATAGEVFRELGLSVETLPFQLPIAEHVSALERLRPDVLYTMPSILDRILASADRTAELGIRRVLLVGELASPGWRHAAAARLGLTELDVADTYGSIEIGTIASYSPEQGRYLLADGLLAEGVPAEALGDGLDPLPEGETVLVLTSALREAFPALRYVTYDVVRDLRPIVAGGRLRQSFAGLVKRIGPDLKHGEKISLYDIEDAVSRRLPDARLRVEMRGNRLAIGIDSPSASDEELELAGRDVEARIPAIGEMIRSGLLESIAVRRVRLGDEAADGPIKRKKIFYGEGESS
ncbi:CoF synthetase [Paenibacillus albicereus]|uniref:CoF synthetase n=1 Tax=Paenibacillus albicereus TaxID=2726185 RepID=A0A6H2H0G0_9BACL|nr:CoF synthetase [Paenibacillus albicereus]QJC53173.1 CoF synthetase [Paenibacillus albicereus]